MKRAGQKALSLLLSLAIVLWTVQGIGALPAFAAGERIVIGGVEVDSADWYATTDGSGAVTTAGASAESWNIHVVTDAATATITLKDATIASESTFTILIENYDLNIVLEGTANQIGTDSTASGGMALNQFTGGSISITGAADLTVMGNYGIVVYGTGGVNIDMTGSLRIESTEQMIITEGTLAVEAASIHMFGYGVSGNGISMTATNGNISIEGDDYGIETGNDTVVTLAALQGSVSVSGTRRSIDTGYYGGEIDISARDNVELQGQLFGKVISVASQTGDITIRGSAYYQAISGMVAEGALTLSAPQGDITVASDSTIETISGAPGYTLDITARGTLDVQGLGIRNYGSAALKADIVRITASGDGYTLSGGSLVITSPQGGNCSEVYITGGGGNRNVISSTGDVTIQADEVNIIANDDAMYAINAPSGTVTIGDTGIIIGRVNIGTSHIAPGVICAALNGGALSDGLDLSVPPAQSTYYEVADGRYIVYTPAQGGANASLILHDVNNAGYLIDGITLPNAPVTIYAEGVNYFFLINASDNITVASSGKLNVDEIINTNPAATLQASPDVELNAWYYTESEGITTATLMGSMTESSDITISATSKLTLSPGSVLTLAGSMGLAFMSNAVLSDLTIGAGASIVNNSSILFPMGTTVAQIRALPLSGLGVVAVATSYDEHGAPASGDAYTNEGVPLIQTMGGLDLTSGDNSDTTLEDNGYEWDAGSRTLTLDGALIAGGEIALPTDEITINIVGESVLIGDFEGEDSTTVLHLTITGNAPLSILGDVNGGSNGDTITVTGGAQVAMNGSIFLGGSSGQDGTLNVSGSGTELNVASSSHGAYAVMCDAVNVSGGASLIASAESEGGTMGVLALSGVSVTGGSTLETGCDYGVYIIGGSLFVDATSTLITNGTVAPFCIVDTTSAKSQSQVLTLPAIPGGTLVTYAVGDAMGYEYNFWSLIPTGGTLSVQHSNSEPADLFGAAIGRLSFAAPADGPDPEDPEDPGDPDAPVNPANPGDPINPGNPGYPTTPGSTGSTGGTGSDDADDATDGASPGAPSDGQADPADPANNPETGSSAGGLMQATLALAATAAVIKRRKHKKA